MFSKFVKKFSNWKSHKKKVDNLQNINDGSENWWEYVGRPHIEPTSVPNEFINSNERSTNKISESNG